MKLIFTCLLLSFSVFVSAQDAKLNETSVTYKGKTFTLGDIIELGYGSGTNKDFSFVKYGKSLGGMNIPKLFKDADANWSKAEIDIEKISSVNGVIWLRGSAVNRGKSLGSILGNKIFINLEGAVDNNEIKGVVRKSKDQKGQKEKNNNDNVQNAPPPSPSDKLKKANNNPTADAPAPTPSKASNKNGVNTKEQGKKSKH